MGMRAPFPRKARSGNAGGAIDGGATTLAENSTAAKAGEFHEGRGGRKPLCALINGQRVEPRLCQWRHGAVHVFPQPGDMLYCWLKSGGNVAYGATLEQPMARLQATSTGAVVAVAERAVDASGGVKRIKVRRLAHSGYSSSQRQKSLGE